MYVAVVAGELDEHDEVNSNGEAYGKAAVTPVEDAHNLFKPRTSSLNTVLTDVDENGPEANDGSGDEEAFRRVQERGLKGAWKPVEP
jgi:hypothetical protein